MDIDEQLQKVAAERNVQPLATALGVRLADSEQLLQKIAQQGFFEEMARYGHRAKDEAAAARMLKVAELVEERLRRSDNDQDNVSDDVFKLAGERLSRSIGAESPEAQASALAGYEASGLKVSQYVADPEIAKLLLSRHDGYSLLGSE